MTRLLQDIQAWHIEVAQINEKIFVSFFYKQTINIFYVKFYY